MQLVILAAGRGTRMAPLTETVPKPMVPILGKPKLQYTLDNLPKAITEIVVVVGYLGKKISDFFGDEYEGRSIKYVLQKDLNGTAGAILACRELLKDHFLVIMGDDFYLESDIEKMVQEDLAILANRVSAGTTGAKIVMDENNNLVEIVESFDPRNSKIKSNLINTGCYRLNKNYFNYQPVAISDTEFGLPQTMVQMLSDYPIKIIETDKWFPLSRVEDVVTAEKIAKDFFRF
ncbi:MAG TPA: nucleotidyltransferase family protein [Candidatus Moranbacteria bacterium]|nr:nucleotidyltransferase family protein [Candidatus Moranbacteria bacterium]